ncbi:MAG: delta fatty acid desaturase [Dehalococcoidia bacterium]|nr:MAG: delta fatty acid desaturase [Dehalococcoidia bacterium]
MLPPLARANEVPYAPLRRAVLAAGLLDRRYGYYVFVSLRCVALYFAALVLAVLLPASFWSVLLAGVALGFAGSQTALLGHDAAHSAVFRRSGANRLLGMVCWSLGIGVSYWWWREKHDRHHGHTNDIDRDPDLVGGGIIVFRGEDAVNRTGLKRLIVRHQAFLLPALFLIAGLVMRWESTLYAIRKLRDQRRLVDLALITGHLASWLALAAIAGPHVLVIFLVAQLAGGFYFALIVSPNHKGMPVWEGDAPLGFLARQVLSSRNVAPGLLTDFLFGGLNYQVEHHLFPTMPRINFRRARTIVRAYCRAHGLPYDETGLVQSYIRLFGAMHRIGRGELAPEWQLA